MRSHRGLLHVSMTRLQETDHKLDSWSEICRQVEASHIFLPIWVWRLSILIVNNRLSLGIQRVPYILPPFAKVLECVGFYHFENYRSVLIYWPYWLVDRAVTTSKLADKPVWQSSPSTT